MTFTYTRSEYLRAMRRYYWRQLNAGRDSAIAAVASLVGAYLVFATSSPWFGWPLLVAGLLLLGVLLFAIVVVPSQQYRSQPKLKSEYRLRFADDQIHFNTDEIDARLQ